MLKVSDGFPEILKVSDDTWEMEISAGSWEMLGISGGFSGMLEESDGVSSLERC